MKHDPIKTLTDLELMKELQERLEAQDRFHFFLIDGQRESDPMIRCNYGDEFFFTEAIYSIAGKLGKAMKKSPVYNIVGKDLTREISQNVMRTMRDAQSKN